MILKIELQTAELDRALTRLAAAVGDMLPIMRIIGGEMEAATERNLMTKARELGLRGSPQLFPRSRGSSPTG